MTLLTGALAAGQWQWPALTEGATLSEAQLSTYKAVIAAIGKPGVNQVDPAKGSEAASVFTTFVDQQGEDSQAIIRFILDELESGSSEGPFSQLSIGRRRQFLRQWIGDSRGALPSLSGEEPTLDGYLDKERRRSLPSRPAASCDPEWDSNCPQLPSGGRPSEKLALVRLPESTMHSYVAGHAIMLAAAPFFPATGIAV